MAKRGGVGQPTPVEAIEKLEQTQREGAFSTL
jgi:hypothetical protein